MLGWAMSPRARLGKNLRRMRVEIGSTQEALAVDAKLQTAHVSRIERGLANPTVDVLFRLARALNKDIGDLFVIDAPAAQNMRRGRKRKQR